MKGSHFKPFRQQIIGIDHEFEGPYGKKKLIYADWTASGRLYRPIEQRLMDDIAPLVANTHTETTHTGRIMTLAYHEAKQTIKEEVNARDAVLIFCGSGMTGAVNKLQRIMGLKVPERMFDYARQKKDCSYAAYAKRRDCHTPFPISGKQRPVVFITHMEHHSNHTSWLETIADVVVIPAADDGLVDPQNLKELLKQYKKRKVKIASVTACSNVTGIETPYHEIAKLMHAAGGYCFVDFACSGPYVHIDMNPKEEGAHLDAIFLSPHKFLGGPGTSGIVIFNPCLYSNRTPDIPGGGTVTFTDPWENREYIEDIEIREDGGTPPFLQGIRAAMAFKLKAAMGTEQIRQREEVLVKRIFKELTPVENLKIFAATQKHRLGVVSFMIDDLHYNLAVQLLNDRFGIQMRGGCACAGTYGHYLFEIDQRLSKKIVKKILGGNLLVKPGFVRLSIHPTTPKKELNTILAAIKSMAANHKEWAKDYKYNTKTNEFSHKKMKIEKQFSCSSWFKF